MEEQFIKGIWVSQFDMKNIYCENGFQRDIEEYTEKVRKVVKNIASVGINTVFLQLRPYGDSFYPSEYYPPSEYAVGSYENNFGYDPIEIFLKSAKAEGLSVHAWINPLRLMEKAKISLIPKEYPIWNMYINNRLSEYDGRLYLNPAYEDAIELITNGAREILEKYDFAGLHIDDYFYPTTSEEFDRQAFSVSGFESLGEFRVSNINRLIKSLYSTVKQVNENLLFGVSPSGNLKTILPVLSADVFEWCSSEGYVDYILPQIYFGFLHGTCPFIPTLKEWKAIIKNEKIKLYIGVTLGKAVNGSKGIADSYAVTEAGKNEWINDKSVLLHITEYITSCDDCDGYSFFCYQYFFDTESGELNMQIEKELEDIIPVISKSSHIK